MDDWYHQLFTQVSFMLNSDQQFCFTKYKNCTDLIYTVLSAMISVVYTDSDTGSFKHKLVWHGL